MNPGAPKALFLRITVVLVILSGPTAHSAGPCETLLRRELQRLADVRATHALRKEVGISRSDE